MIFGKLKSFTAKKDKNRKFFFTKFLTTYWLKSRCLNNNKKHWQKIKRTLSQYFYNYWLHTAQLYQETPWKQIAGSAIFTKSISNGSSVACTSYYDITVVIFCSRSYDSDRVLYYKQLKDCIRQWHCVVLEAIKGLHVAAVCRIRSYYSLHLCSMQRPSGHHCVSLPWPS